MTLDLSLELLFVPAMTTVLTAVLLFGHGFVAQAKSSPQKAPSKAPPAAEAVAPLEMTEEEQKAASKLQARVRGNSMREVEYRDPVIFEGRLSTADL